MASNYVSEDSVRAASTLFDEFLGSDLELCGVTASHDTFMFRSSHISNQFGRIHFGSVMDVDITPLMHNVRLRMSTMLENASLVERMTKSQSQYAASMDDMGYSLHDNVIVIECEEGIFTIWAHRMFITWWPDASVGLEQEVNHRGETVWNFDVPLWKEGPRLSTL